MPEPRARRAAALALVALALVALAAGCAGADDEEDAAAPARTNTIDEPAPTGETAERPTETVEEAAFGTTTATRPPQSAETALLERIRLGRNAGYDRVVFEFRNAVPGYRIAYAEPPFREDGSGARVAVSGSAFALVRMEPASGFDMTAPEGALVYKGPRRIAGEGAGTETVREIVRTGDFEGATTWAVGLDARLGFRVLTLDGPPRLVVDFRSG